VGSKPFAVEAQSTATGEWESPRAGQRYRALQAGVQLANRSGAINDIEFSEFVVKVQAFADAVGADPSIRAVVLRGHGGTFCSGGDIKDIGSARNAESADGLDPVEALNRSFGAMLSRLEALPAALIVLCEGAVLGGGFGLACVGDVTLSSPDARFRLPETGLGITPAQTLVPST